MAKYKNTKIENSILNFIKQYKQQKILLAISGGQDSILLAKSLDNLKNYDISKKIKIAYIYVDHQWKKSSDEQIKHLINYLKSHNNKIIIYQMNTVTLSEQQCRQYRYNIIIQYAIINKYKLIITGHNLTDKVETFINNISRSNNIESFNSLAISNRIYKKFFFRPLINTKRENIYWMCKKMYLPIWSDITNYIYEIPRNRIRQEIIPYMKKYLNKNIENNLQSLLINYQYENDYIKQNTIKLYLKSIHHSKAAIKYNKFKMQNFVLQIRIIQLFCFHNFQEYLENKKVTQIIEIINQPFSQSTKIIEEKYFVFFINKNWIYLILKS